MMRMKSSAYFSLRLPPFLGLYEDMQIEKAVGPIAEPCTTTALIEALDEIAARNLVLCDLPDKKSTIQL